MTTAMTPPQPMPTCTKCGRELSLYDLGLSEHIAEMIHLPEVHVAVCSGCFEAAALRFVGGEEEGRVVA